LTDLEIPAIHTNSASFIGITAGQQRFPLFGSTAKMTVFGAPSCRGNGLTASFRLVARGISSSCRHARTMGIKSLSTILMRGNRHWKAFFMTSASSHMLQAVALIASWLLDCLCGSYRRQGRRRCRPASLHIRPGCGNGFRPESRAGKDVEEAITSLTCFSETSPTAQRDFRRKPGQAANPSETKVFL
jgi:hypothetical protein